jgi:hypothetical protein
MTKPTIEGIQATLIAMGSRQDRMEHEMEMIKNRLPAWVTIVITILGSIVTGLMTKGMG